MAFLNFRKPKIELEKGGRAAAEVQEDASEPEKTCPNCHKSIPLSRLWAAWNTCPCGYHFRMSARQRLALIADKDSFTELFADTQSIFAGRKPVKAVKRRIVERDSGCRESSPIEFAAADKTICVTDCCRLQPAAADGNLDSIRPHFLP